MANRTRNIVLRVPVPAQEREMIELKMQQMGTRCFSVYARKMLIDGYVIKIDYSDIKAMTAELQKIGTNINQIARRVNATGTGKCHDQMGTAVQRRRMQKGMLPYGSIPSWLFILNAVRFLVKRETSQGSRFSLMFQQT